MAAAFHLSEVVTSARGSKTSRLRTSDGADVVYSTTNNGMCAPFGPGNFDKNAPGTRVNLAVGLDDEDVLAFLMGSTNGPFDVFRKTPIDYLSA